MKPFLLIFIFFTFAKAVYAKNIIFETSGIAKVGQDLEMDILDKKHKVTVIEDSPYDPNNEKLRN